MVNILTIVTGGTFGAKAVEGIRSVDQSEGQDSVINRVIGDYLKDKPDIVTFDTPIELEPKLLSENMTISAWDRLVKLLKANADKLSSCDGVIVTHGTDTMAYTAPLFSALLGHLDKPVVFVSSDAPIDTINSKGQMANGRKNFEDAVDFIVSEHRNISGVFVAYSYDLEETTFYIAEHITQAPPFTDKYGSYAGHDFGVFKNGKFEISTHGDLRANYYKKRSGNLVNILDKIDVLKNNVLLVMPYVGLDYSRLDLQGVKAVLHGTYHSFTMCLDDKIGGAFPSEPKHSSVDYLFEKCKDLGIAFYFSSYDEKRNPEPYETTEYMLKKGASFILNSSTEYAYVRLLAGHNIQNEDGRLSDDLLGALNLKLL